MNQLYFMEIEPLINNNVLDEMLLYVSSEKKERLRRYRFDMDRKIGVYSEVLIRCLICMKSGATYRDIKIKVSPTGKPFLTSFPRYEFNISHTRNAIAAALSDEPVGVDIERIRDVDFSIAKKVFSVNELVWLNGATDDRNIRFFDVWTKKEALLKYDGRGLSNDLKSFDVTARFPCKEITTFMADGYIISICSRTKPQVNDIVKISEPELIEMWRRCANYYANEYGEG